MKKRIVLCADDYGQATAISQGIISLIEKARISATSCIVTSPLFSTEAQRLIPWKNKIDLGLHFNLTEGEPLSKAFKNEYGSLIPLSKLLWLTSARKLKESILIAECEAQLKRFKDVMGMMPDYIDGHQHAHQFSVIRQALIRVYKNHLHDQKTYIRLVNPRLMSSSISNIYKKLVIRMTGTQQLRQMLQAASIPFNSSFAGIYPFSQSKKYPHFFNEFLNQVQNNGLIMCHPATGLGPSDRIATARFHEYKYLMSDQFSVDCSESGVEITRFSPASFNV